WPFWIPHHLHAVFEKVAKAAPDHFFAKTLPQVLEAVRIGSGVGGWEDHQPFVKDAAWQIRLFRHDHTGGEPLTEFVAVAAASLAPTDYSTLKELLGKLSS